MTEELLLAGAFWGIIFLYFHIYRPPREIHNENDLDSTMKNLQKYLGYDVTSLGIRNDEVDLWIISHPDITKGLLNDLQTTPVEEEETDEHEQ